MTDFFTSEFFRNNRQNLRRTLQSIPLVLTAHGSLQRSQDTAYEFTQDGHFWYLTGLDDPDIILVLEGSTEYLIIPELSASKIYFDGDLVSDDLRRISGIKTILNHEEGMKRLKATAIKNNKIAILQPPPEYIDQLGMYTNPSRQYLQNRLNTMNKNLEYTDCREYIARLRMVKQPTELRALQVAIDVTCGAVEKTMEQYLQGRFETERQVELFLRAAFYLGDGNGHAFEPIVASGSSACTIHPVVSKMPIGDKPLLVDVGAAVSAYKADISRTWAIKPSERYRSVLLAVKDVSDYAMTQLKPGVVLREYERLVEKYMGKKLKELGVITTAKRSDIRAFFPHLTSHFLGIDVHDVGVYDDPLQAGCVLTVEPGIYIKDEGIGVRIENDVLITENGCKNLSASLADLQPNL